MEANTILNILEFLGHYGFIGIAIALMIEVIPSEIVLAYAGFLVASGRISFFSALTAGVIGGTLAQVFLYLLGKYAGRTFFENYGKYILIHPKHLNKADKWFQSYGPATLFTARFIPIVRHAISVPAGIVKMPFVPFIVYTSAAILPWSLLFLLIGIQLNQHWNRIGQVSGPYIKPIIIIACTALLIYVLYKHFLNKKR
ncbi:DedA family protein [Heyndrickxia acidicola]|uniref:DedA family protein n=1 Tax=Heyndrickxia acidicola TaxID=209389 RepID=A0ABU6MQ93_9BACI|nr:DedA family protein [Heyndrickxia acidicola]MED1205397.1 DedA family protein [Heyndrickxia acidicola]